MTGDAFTRALARTVVAQIFDGVGIHNAHRSVLDTMSDVMLRYISAIGDRAHVYAEHAGRTESNLNDVLLAFSDLGASVTDIMKYVEFAEEIPFAHPIPKFPVRKKSRLSIPSFDQMDEKPPSQNIPSWLPAFPDKHTYVATPAWVERRNDARNDRIQQGKERRHAEDALINLHYRVQALTTGSGKELWGAQSSSFKQGAEAKVENKDEKHKPRVENQSRLVSEGNQPSLKSASVSTESVNPFTTPPLAAEAFSAPSLNDLGLPPEFQTDQLLTGIGGTEQTCSKPSILGSFSDVLDGKQGKADVDEVELWDEDEDVKSKEENESGWTGWKVPEKMHGVNSPSPSQDKLHLKAIATRALISASESKMDGEDEKKRDDSDREGGIDDH